MTEGHDLDLGKVLIKDFSELKFPDYKDRAFWENLPGKIQADYIKKGEQCLDYDWPVVKATDYLEIIRSGDRRQNVYSKPRAALTALVMGERGEGEGRFLDELITGVGDYREPSGGGGAGQL